MDTTTQNGIEALLDASHFENVVFQKPETGNINTQAYPQNEKVVFRPGLKAFYQGYLTTQWWASIKRRTWAFFGGECCLCRFFTDFRGLNSVAV